MPSPTPDIATFVASVKRFGPGVAESIMDEVSTLSTAVGANPGMPIYDVLSPFKAKGISVMRATGIKKAIVPPSGSTPSFPIA
jgi:hypothetical protein